MSLPMALENQTDESYEILVARYLFVVIMTVSFPRIIGRVNH